MLILHYSELWCFFDEVATAIQVQNIRNTKDEQGQAAWKIILSVWGEYQKQSSLVEAKIRKSEYYNALPARYEPVKAYLEKSERFYVEANEPLKKEVRTLFRQRQDSVGEIEVVVGGTALLRKEAMALFESDDSDVARIAWQGVQQAFVDRRDDLQGIYTTMLERRWEMAGHAKEETPFVHQHLEKAWTPEMTSTVNKAVRVHMAPLARVILERRRQRLGLESHEFMPWHEKMTPSGLEPLSPADSAEELLEKGEALAGRIHPEIAALFKGLDIDLEARINKEDRVVAASFERQGNFSVTMQQNGTHADVMSLAHEAIGHEGHTRMSAHQDLFFLRAMFEHSPEQTREMVAMSMEAIATEEAGVFYSSPEDIRRVQQNYFEQLVINLCWFSVLSAFEEWAYTDKASLDPDARDAKYLELLKEYGLYQDNWSEYDNLLASRWMSSQHLFETAFLMMQYVFAQLGALQMDRRYYETRDDAVARAGVIGAFIRGQQLGNTRPIAEIWETMGVGYDFSDEMVAGLTQYVEERLAGLEG